MKKLILMLLLSFLVFTIAAQTKMFESTAFAYRKYDKVKMVWGDFTEWEKTSNIIITYNTEKAILKINNKFNDVFKLTGIISEKKGYDTNDGDPFTQMIFDAIDNNGDKCSIGMQLFDSGTWHFTAYYDNIIYVYQAEQLE